MSRDWLNQAIEILEADFQRSADTHLIPVPLPFSSQLDLYFKDESTHPTGSLKHRLARSLFLYGLCNGWIGPQTAIIEASSGSTAVSEAYFARLLGRVGSSADVVAEIERALKPGAPGPLASVQTGPAPPRPRLPVSARVASTASTAKPSQMRRFLSVCDMQ